MRTFDQDATVCVGDMSVARIIVGCRLRYGKPRIQMQFPIAPIVIEAIGQIDILLDFDDDQARPDRMDRAGGFVDEIASMRLSPEAYALDRAVQGGIAQCVDVADAGEAYAQLCICRRTHTHPALFVSAAVQNGSASGGRRGCKVVSM